MPWHQPARDRAFKGKCGRKIASPRRETARPLLDARLFDRRFELRRRPSQPKQHWDFHQTERRLTPHRSGDIARSRKKSWFKIPIQITNYANIVPSHYNVDLAVSYDMGDQPENEYLRNISLQLVVNNVTNKKLKAEF